MKGKLIGVMHKSGVFKPKDKNEEIKYDNLVFFALEKLAESSDPDNFSEGEGYYLHTFKVKCDKVDQICDYPVKHLSDFDQFKGAVIEWSYNKFGNVENIKLTEG